MSQYTTNFVLLQGFQENISINTGYAAALGVPCYERIDILSDVSTRKYHVPYSGEAAIWDDPWMIRHPLRLDCR